MFPSNIPAGFSSPLSPDKLLISKEFFEDLAAGKQRTVVLYGTSLTAGGAWVDSMKEWFDKRYPGLVTLINSGGPGENSDWGVAHLKEKVLDHDPALVFIEFSYNDAHDKFEMSLERGASNLHQMVEGIKSGNPGAQIVLQVMNIGWDAPNGNRSLSVRPMLDQFNDNYRNCARSHQFPLLDHYVNWKKLKETTPEVYQSYVPDGSHPTPEGSLKVTWPLVESLLNDSARTAGN